MPEWVVSLCGKSHFAFWRRKAMFVCWNCWDKKKPKEPEVIASKSPASSFLEAEALHYSDSPRHLGTQIMSGHQSIAKRSLHMISQTVIRAPTRLFLHVQYWTQPSKSCKYRDDEEMRSPGCEMALLWHLLSKHLTAWVPHLLLFLTTNCFPGDSCRTCSKIHGRRQLCFCIVC